MGSFCLLLLISGARASCPTCTSPTWSWDTLPAFFHSSEHNGPKGGFSSIAMKTISKFPMVTIEKWQGDRVEPSIFEEQAWLVAARQIKQSSPKTTVIVWLDSLRIYTADKSLNPDIKGECTEGHFQPAEWLETGGKMDGKADPSSVYLLKNSSGLPALETSSGCHIFDHTQAIAREYWTTMCLNLTKSGVIDGCGADASWQNGVDQAQKWGLTPAMAAQWGMGHKQMMRNTTALLGDGVLLGKDPWEVGDYVNGALHEGCPAVNATILTLQNLTARAASMGKRLIYQCHGGHNLVDETSSSGQSCHGEGFVDEIAAFLIGAGEYHYFGCGGWNGGPDFTNHRPAEMDKKLGAPKGPGVYNSLAGKWTREFASGTKVIFDPKTKKGTITWAEDEVGAQNSLLI